MSTEKKLRNKKIKKNLRIYENNIYFCQSNTFYNYRVTDSFQLY
jgi:hypothetical protein